MNNNFYNFLLEYGTSAYVIIHVFTLLFVLLICIYFQIAVVIPHYFKCFFTLSRNSLYSLPLGAITAKSILLYSNSCFCNASPNTTRKHLFGQNTSRVTCYYLSSTLFFLFTSIFVHCPYTSLCCSMYSL
jgi:hypothetical protein